MFETITRIDSTNNKRLPTAHTVVRYYMKKGCKFKSFKYMLNDLKNSNHKPFPPDYIIPKVKNIREFDGGEYSDKYTDVEIQKYIRLFAKRYENKLAYYENIMYSLIDYSDEKSEFVENIKNAKSINYNYMHLLEMLYELLKYLPTTEYITEYLKYKKIYPYFHSTRYYDEEELSYKPTREKDKWGTIAHYEWMGKNITSGHFYYDYLQSS